MRVLVLANDVTLCSEGGGSKRNSQSETRKQAKFEQQGNEEDMTRETKHTVGKTNQRRVERCKKCEKKGYRDP